MKQFSFLFILLVLISTGLFSQPSGNRIDEKPFIEVTGIAEQEIVPDEIFVSITLREIFVNREKVTIDAQETRLKEALTSIGISLNNLSLADADADYVRVRWTRKDLLTRKDYILKLNSAMQVGQVFQELDKLEINDANVSRVNHSKIDSLNKAVKIMAIKAAKEKADYLLAAINEKTGQPLIINESGQKFLHASPGVINTRGARLNEVEYFVDGVKTKGIEKEIQFEKIKIRSEIYVKFLIL
jgi:uncharacterized protein YggE